MINQNPDQPDLGPCCACRGIENVRNIILVNKLAPVPGTGWGCFECDLSMDGAIAVVCDECIDNNRAFNEVCYGLPDGCQRVAYDSLPDTHFDHDLSQHPEGLSKFDYLDSIEY